jgi:methylated-DNA-[protein]-cysteine S-methyltransferase
MSTTTYFTTLASPIGPLTLTANAAGTLTGVYFEGHEPEGRADWVEDERRLRDARTQMIEYFAGRRTRFDLPLAPQGTPFQRRVWSALRAIPFGATASYGDIARAVGAPGAARAVGSANHENPLAIVVPCHRVVGAKGKLTGYGGGLDRKRWLLEHEAAGARA